ncbi:unnamed protein product [Dimorphilus gyrociliatus]|uniref:Uncharacterized protein n=1 Tax=Dimorphilus gyrociliatus TaxID=2664684 RepID=A0A7I8VAU7_9ANNE|nr:unnamed protein product [Dimorphilus gyrociliatus]
MNDSLITCLSIDKELILFLPVELSDTDGRETVDSTVLIVGETVVLDKFFVPELLENTIIVAIDDSIDEMTARP